jgi:hypothetical protein
MARKRTPGSAQVMAQVGKLSVAVPQVIAHRVGRMAAAGPVLSARDRKEFVGMVVEKQVAFAQSMQGMWLASLQAQQNLWQAWSRSLAQSLWQPPWMAPAASSGLARQAQRAGLSVISQGLAPLERKASSNARRLARTRRR